MCTEIFALGDNERETDMRKRLPTRCRDISPPAWNLTHKRKRLREFIAEVHNYWFSSAEDNRNVVIATDNLPNIQRLKSSTRQMDLNQYDRNTLYRILKATCDLLSMGASVSFHHIEGEINIADFGSRLKLPTDEHKRARR